MRPITKTLLCGAALAALLPLAAADWSERRARTHYDRAMALVDAGDSDRAVLELKSALQAKDDHIPALRVLAGMLRAQADTHGAVRHYLRLAELQPDDFRTYLALAELSLALGDHAAVEAYSDRAVERAPSQHEVRALAATVAYRRGETEAALDLAAAVLAEAPGSVPASMVMIADRMAAGDVAAALRLIDSALERNPGSEDLHLARLAALERMGAPAALGDQLDRMAKAFPDSLPVLQALARWHLAQGASDAALAVLRQLAERTPEDPSGFLDVAQLILETHGPEAARVELEQLAWTHPTSAPFRRALARLDFSQGRTGEAIEALRLLVAEREETPEKRDLSVALAQMLLRVGDEGEARALIEAVLAADEGHVEALKMRARWRIEADRTDLALADLWRAALLAPRDPEIMTLEAMAHEREGSTDRVGERLARAMEAAGHAPADALRYARFLIRDGRLGQAEGILVDALRRAPDDADLLLALGQVHLRRQDHTRARHLAGILRETPAPSARSAAAGLEFEALMAQGDFDAATSLLETLAADEPEDMRPRAALVQARLAAGDPHGAEAAVRDLLARDPRSRAGRMLMAGIELARGRPDEAEALYRSLIAERPDQPEPYQSLVAVLNVRSSAEARALLDEGLAATGRATGLLNLKAALLHTEQDYDGAIALFEEVYRRDSSDMVAANNLASLLSRHRDDEASLERAFQVARRLRGTTIPHFQDTYGWLLVRRGDPGQALAYLEPAAAALIGDPLVQFHLGMAQFELGRLHAARASLTRALDLGAGRPDLPQIERQRLAEIERRSGKPAGD